MAPFFISSNRVQRAKGSPLAVISGVITGLEKIRRVGVPPVKLINREGFASGEVSEAVCAKKTLDARLDFRGHY